MAGDKPRYEAKTYSEVNDLPSSYNNLLEEVRDILLYINSHKFVVWDNKLEKQYRNGQCGSFHKQEVDEKIKILNTKEFNKKLKGFIND